jgi:hypothetical protein
MKIGVFGDSFAEKHWVSDTWWRSLENHGHDVTCYGQAGSSILFSANMIDKHAHNFDFLIWGLTCPGRISLPIDESRYAHLMIGSQHSPKWFEIDGFDFKKKIQAYNDYLKYLYIDDDENMTGQALAYWFMQKYQNLMIIPCFRPPLHTKFNLYKLSEWELEHFFPVQQSWNDIHQKYQDIRAGHLTNANNKILAELINQNLKPGVFQTEYSNFEVPNVPFDQIMQKKYYDFQSH